MSSCFISTSKSSKRATVLWRLSKRVFLCPIERVLSDNGGEFKAAFDVEVAQDGVGRWLTYPKTPKMNAHVERFQDSLQNEFAAYYEDLLFTDVNLFNGKLLDYRSDSTPSVLIMVLGYYHLMSS